MLAPSAQLSAPFARAVRLALVLVPALVVAMSPARAQFQLEPAYPETPLAGPAAAKGAVIWSHGINFLYGTEASGAPVPVFVTLFRDDGWDVFRLLRPRVGEEPRGSAAEIAATARRLKQQGYGKIVLAGQSGGAWVSLMAAGESDDIHAVIANAPAYYGTDRPSYLKNGFILYHHLDRIRRGRIMISYFKGDPYDPGERGSRSDQILSAHGVPHLVVDQPDGLIGHLGGDTALFLRRFGKCILAVAGDEALPRREDCESDWGRHPSADLRLPRDLAVAEPVDEAGPFDPFLGKWYGFYDDGRELILVIERVTGSDVDAVYAVGPGLDKATAAVTTHRRGQLVNGDLVFAEEGRSTLRYQPRADGQLDAQWRSADQRTQLEAVLRRIP